MFQELKFSLNFHQQLEYWKHYTNGQKEISKTNHLQITTDALSDLVKIKDQFRKEIQQGRANKAIVSKVCESVDSIERIVQCLFSDDIEKNATLDDASSSVRGQVLDIDIEDLHPKNVIAQLTKLPLNASALNALIEIEGFPILARSLNITSKDLMHRCFLHAGLGSVESLINLLKENTHEKNIVKIIKDHLDKSREEACAKMGLSHRNAFEKQWNQFVKRDWIYEGKITPQSLSEPNKIEAWDFLKKADLDIEIKDSKEGELLKKTRLYQGEKGDFFLIISNYKVPESDQALLGNDNFAKLKEFDNYLWSPDGKSFHLMNSTGYGGSGEGYNVSFETKEGTNERIGMKVVNQIYATLKTKDQTIAIYERQNLESIRQTFASIKSSEAKIVPLQHARTPAYLFQMEDGQYIYVDETHAHYEYGFQVSIGKDGNFRKHEVLEAHRYRDGGTTNILLANNECIHAPFNKTPSYTDSTGKIHTLRDLGSRGFDYNSIGIKLEPMNSRPTMLDLYQ
jgi:hypothetical protein